MANLGHYQGEGTTRQGIYVCTPNGELMSSINSLNADDVLQTIESGLEKWNDLTKSDIQFIPDFKMNVFHRWENSFPENGLVLTSFNADLFTDPPNQDERSDRWNMDYVWFNKFESREWIPVDPKKGEIYELPKKLANRLFCFHMVDNVRGQTLPFAPQELKKSQINIEIIDLHESFVEI